MSNDVKKSDFGDVFPELTVVQGVVLRGVKIVIPKILQAAVQAAHEGHQRQDHTVRYL